MKARSFPSFDALVSFMARSVGLPAEHVEEAIRYHRGAFTDWRAIDPAEMRELRARVRGYGHRPGPPARSAQPKRLSPAQMAMLDGLSKGLDLRAAYDYFGGRLWWQNAERVADSLVRRGLISQDSGDWDLTEAGRAALKSLGSARGPSQ